MIILSETTDSIQCVLTGNILSNQLQCVTSWRDRTSTTFVAGRTLINTNNTTDVDISGSPAASTQRVIDMISIYNKDTVDQEVIVKLDANGTEYILQRRYLLPDQTMMYANGLGWNVFGGYRPIKIFTVHGDAGVNFAMTNATQAERFAGAATTRHLFMVDLLGYSQVRLRANVVVGSVSVNTPVFRAKYYTSFDTTVGNFLTLGTSEVEISVATVTYVDTGWIDLVAGAKADGICIGFTEAGGNGTADPALGATDILFR